MVSYTCSVRVFRCLCRMTYAIAGLSESLVHDTNDIVEQLVDFFVIGISAWGCIVRLVIVCVPRYHSVFSSSREVSPHQNALIT